MALTITEAVANAMLNVLADAADAEVAAGDMQIATAADFVTVLATFTLVDPAFGAAASKEVVMDCTPAIEATVAQNGTAAAFRIRDSAGTEVVRGTVAKTSGGDINFDENVWVATGTATLTAFKFTCA